MIRNHLLVAVRNLLKFRVHAAINILGLAVGIACCLLIMLFIREELRVDQHHRHLDDLYRVGTVFIGGESEEATATSPSPLAAALQRDFPEVLAGARLIKAPSVDKYLLRNGDRSFFESRGFLVDSSFFSLLTFDFVAGDPAHALDEPNTVVLSEEIAGKLFPEGAALGGSLRISSLWGEEEYRVTGIFRKGTYPSHLDGNFYMSLRSGAIGRRFYQLAEWGGNNLYYTYIRLQPGVSAKALEAKLPPWLDTYAGERLKQLGFSKRHFLEPVKDIYLRSKVGMAIGPVGNIGTLHLLGGVAVFILFIACINFMNLTTARATVRTREVGVRKVVGAGRRPLVLQFLSEAFLYAGLAVLLAYVLAELALPSFNRLTGKELPLNPVNDPMLAVWLVGLVVLTTLAAGIYPALYLSSFKPLDILRGRLGDRWSTVQVRRVLVTVQFIISIALIQGIFVIYQQLEYLRKKDLGFAATDRIVVPLNTPESAQHFAALKTEFLKNSQVRSAGGASAYPGIFHPDDLPIFGEGQTVDEGRHTYMAFIEPDYLEVMDFKLTAGRLFSRDRPADTVGTAVINETLMRSLGYGPEDALGRQIFYQWGDERNAYRIIGVVQDFHIASLREPIDGFAFFWRPGDFFNYLVAEVETAGLPRLLTALEETWTRLNPAEPFQYSFLNEELQQAYLAEQRLGGLILWSTLLAIFVACLGLLGLAAFAAERRTKEISIRKVLGASVPGIIGLLSRDFLRLVVAAFVIATPLAWHLMQRWLREFAFHVDLQWWGFALSGALALLIAFGIVAIQSLRAARANPAEILKRE